MSLPGTDIDLFHPAGPWVRCAACDWLWRGSEAAAYPPRAHEVTDATIDSASLVRNWFTDAEGERLVG